jgi:Holliday junction DNA helicase RuvA
VREDALDLFGFASKLEKDIFLTLLTVNGIGPKGAMGILSKVDTNTLIGAILDGDKDTLVAIPGVGKKTAERVVLELADPIRKKVEAGLLTVASKTPESRGMSSYSRPATAGTGVQSILGDAKAALIGLGYREHEVTGLLNRIIAEMETPPGKAEDLVRSALRQLV